MQDRDLEDQEVTRLDRGRLLLAATGALALAFVAGVLYVRMVAHNLEERAQDAATSMPPMVGVGEYASVSDQEAVERALTARFPGAKLLGSSDHGSTFLLILSPGYTLGVSWGSVQPGTRISIMESTTNRRADELDSIRNAIETDLDVPVERKK